MSFLPHTPPLGPSQTSSSSEGLKGLFSWLPTTDKAQKAIPIREERILSSIEAVDEVFSRLQPDTHVALQGLDSDKGCKGYRRSRNGWVRITIEGEEYLVNTRLPFTKNMDLGRYPVRFIVENAYDSSSTLARLGINRAVHCLETAKKLTSKFSSLPQTVLKSDCNVIDAIRALWRTMDKSQHQWYALLCKVRPFLANISPFRVNTAHYGSILDSWRDNESQKGKVSEWEAMLKEYGDSFPVILKPDSAVTGRFTMSSPALHSMDRELRNAFFANKDMTLISGDYHQMQPRLVAEEAKDADFRKIFEEGRDLYKVWASIFYEKPEDQVSSSERQSFKAVSLAWLYGMQTDNLVSTIIENALTYNLDGAMTEERARAGLNSFCNRFSKLTQWKATLGRVSLDRGYVVTRFGRKIPFRDRAYRATCFWAQGTEVELMLRLVETLGNQLKKKLPRSRIKLFMHDELILETPKEETMHAAELLKTTMNDTFQLCLPNAPLSNLLDIHISDCWGSLK